MKLMIIAVTLALAPAARASAQDVAPKGERTLFLSYAHTIGSAMEETRFSIPGGFLEYQDRWARPHLWLSGIGIGFGKDGVQTTETGYSFWLRSFRELRPKAATRVSVSAGVAWMMPPAGMSAASFTYDAAGRTASYRRGFVRSNTWSPRPPNENGRLDLLLELRAERRLGKVPLAASARVRPVAFGYDDFYSQKGTVGLSDRRRMVFTIAFGVGLGL